MLAPAAVSHALARWWGREARWLRYAIAFNWCQWVITAGGLTALLLGEIALQIGLPRNAVLIVLSLGFMGYAMALPQFSIWYKRNWGTTIRSMVDGLIYSLLIGGTFGWLW